MPGSETKLFSKTVREKIYYKIFHELTIQSIWIIDNNIYIGIYLTDLCIFTVLPIYCVIGEAISGFL